MEFVPGTFKVGGCVIVPDSFVNKRAEAEITEVTAIGLKCLYYKGTVHEQTAFYSFKYLETMYANRAVKMVIPKDSMKNRFEDEFNDQIPF